MPLNRRKINRLLDRSTIDEEDMPHRLMRAAHSYQKERMLALENKAALALYDEYKVVFGKIAAASDQLAVALQLDSLGRTTAAYQWLEQMKGVIDLAVQDLMSRARPIAAEAATRGAAAGYYLTGWTMAVAVQDDVPVQMPYLSRSDMTGMGLSRVPESLSDQQVIDLIGNAFFSELDAYILDLVPTLRTVLNGAMADGVGMASAMRRVRDALLLSPESYKKNFGKVQALTRTYIMEASNAGAMQTYVNNSDIVGGARHLTARDERVCPICAAMNGDIYPTGEFFIPPRNTHPNCCVRGTVINAPGSITAASKAFYVGRAVEITTASGRSLTVTANHPIYTARGWLAAHLLNESDYVVCSLDPERIPARIQPDDYHPVAFIEDIFNTFVKRRGMFSTRMKPAAEDFHGEGRFMYGDVDIVYADSPLGRVFYAPGEEPGRELSLSDAYAKPSLLAGFCTGELAVEGVSCSSPRLSSSRDVSLAFGKGHAIQPNAKRLSSASPFDSVVIQQAGDDTARYATLARKFLDAAAGDVFFDNVTRVREFDLCDHVYDLQSDPYSLYLANGVLAANCRCTVVPVIAYGSLNLGDAATMQSFGEWLDEVGVRNLYQSIFTDSLTAP